MDNPFEPLLRQFEKIDGLANKVDSLNSNIECLGEKLDDILSMLKSNPAS